MNDTLNSEARSRTTVHSSISTNVFNGPYAPFGFESIEKQLWRNKQNDRPISDSEIKAVLSQLFKCLRLTNVAPQVTLEDVTSRIRSITYHHIVDNYVSSGQ
ncbi:hypothetical protein AVEN_220249-1 [Araneus ventricosus]|uniref:Uncharacterized protein n=1 Tax=Araneus ventricosus TaxID=182803 RepID=A0A4Y2SXM4_ARAVE|nr:hypothetical protein AVEN_220249-1 [Araneus ventricosus]